MKRNVKSNPCNKLASEKIDPAKSDSSKSETSEDCAERLNRTMQGLMQFFFKYCHESGLVYFR